MSESGEENEVNDQNDSGAGDDDEFSFYLQFTKPLVLDLAEPEDRAMAAAWVRKLEGGSDAPEEKQLRINYLKLLLFVLQRGRLGGIFRKQPPSGPLQSFPAGFNIFDMGNLILDQDDLQPSGGGDGRAVNYNIEISSDLREFVASQEIPNFGIQMYYAWSSDEPVYKWTMYDEEKFPQYVLDKIKLLKETQSEEKSGSITKGGSQTKKKVCELPVIEKCPKKKVKSPQEIERSQGRSFHTYMGLVGRMGNFEKCDGDPERYQRPQQQQGRGNCPRRISQGQNQNQCPGQGQRRLPNQDCDDEHGEDGFHNFMPGLSDMVNAQSRPCLCPYPCHHTDCPEHRGGRGESQHDTTGRTSATNTAAKQVCGPSDWNSAGGHTVTKGPAPARFNEFDPNSSRMPSIGPPQGPQGATCPHRRSSSPPPKSNCPSRTNFESPPQDSCGRQNFNQPSPSSNNFCTCPCPRMPQPMIRPTSSTTGVMGGMGNMSGMNGMGGMPGMGGMGGTGGMGCMGVMPGMGGMGMGGMPGMGGMGGMPGMGGMGGTGGMGCMGVMPGMGGMGMGGMSCMGGMGGMGGMPGMGGMGNMSSMGGMGGMANMGSMGGGGGGGGGRFCTSGRQTTQQKSRANIRGHCTDSGQPTANPRASMNAYCPRVDGPPTQGGNRPGPSNTRSRQNLLHCYDNQQADPSFTHTMQKNANAMECPGTYTHQLSAAGEESTKHSQGYMEGAQKSQSAQLPCPTTGTASKRQHSPNVCPTAEARNPGYTSSGSERLVQSDRSTSMEPLSQSPSPRPPLGSCPPPQQVQHCPPKSPKAHGQGFQSQGNYGQDRQICPTPGTKSLSPNRPGTAKTVNMNKPYHNAPKGGGGIFAVNNESGRLCNMPGLLQSMRQMAENYRSQGEEHNPSRPDPSCFDQTDSTFDFDFDFNNYVEPGPPKPDVYYSPQPRRRGVAVSPCPERDIASLPDRTTGMGVFHPQKMPTQAQPLPNTPPDCAYIDYSRCEGDEESFLYGAEESSSDQPRAVSCPPEEPPAHVSPMKPPFPSHQGRERSPTTSEKVRDWNKRTEHGGEAHQCLHEPKQMHHSTSSGRHDPSQKSNRRDTFMCSTNSRSYTALPATESNIYQNCPPDGHQGLPDIILRDFDSPSQTDFVQLFGGNRQDDSYRCPSQQRDAVHFDNKMECQTHHDTC